MIERMSIRFDDHIIVIREEEAANPRLSRVRTGSVKCRFLIGKESFEISEDTAFTDSESSKAAMAEAMIRLYPHVAEKYGDNSLHDQFEYFARLALDTFLP